ncbi:hypothetical protein PPL_10842 [Heterostelium album PN500]|uniref:Uncharacterized protein n=1 Tax=Heterostelium pallidum (strain ATCC 26659 / Pp 5 / PN500) TaxID=670386 RepID=D3BS50_HETP5|nr:hypothetical protein PPL_10842 [Heterostelium album PN500]EFA75787.1 hypothetical protein PPL_10842 [Heterostelium album PN500]|eukprot:XP_020427921.1 hypothetical protein PPL_10842 [Heterostelium album PN500]
MNKFLIFVFFAMVLLSAVSANYDCFANCHRDYNNCVVAKLRNPTNNYADCVDQVYRCYNGCR